MPADVLGVVLAPPYRRARRVHDVRVEVADRPRAVLAADDPAHHAAAGRAGRHVEERERVRLAQREERDRVVLEHLQVVHVGLLAVRRHELVERVARARVDQAHVRVVRGAALDRAGRPERVLAGDAAPLDVVRADPAAAASFVYARAPAPEVRGPSPCSSGSTRAAACPRRSS